MAQDEQQLCIIVAEVGQLPHTAGLQELSRWGFSTPVRSSCSRTFMHSMPMPASGNLPSAQLHQSISSACYSLSCSLDMVEAVCCCVGRSASCSAKLASCSWRQTPS